MCSSALNLMHLSTYCLADEKRLVYSFDTFLIPIAQAFGPFDGEEQQGMFRRTELLGLGKEHMIPTPSVRYPLPAMSTSEIHDSAEAVDETTARADSLIGDVRGDVRSDAALCFQVQSNANFLLGSVPAPALPRSTSASHLLHIRPVYRVADVHRSSPAPGA